ncbi:hypothetical protein [Sinimarinibacterium flocculans]|uniref:hypothetical protein n=1 Tax=Sinimarinibacterium flocculans TaxID=985250 RepID=UPI0035118930
MTAENSGTGGSGRRTKIAALWAGLTRPSVLALGIAGALNVATLVAVGFFVDRDFIARHGELFAANPVDYDAMVTQRIAALAERPPVAGAVVVLGSSITLAAILEPELNAALDSHGLADMQVAKLCTGRQSPLDALALVEQLPRQLRGVVVAGVTAESLTHSAATAVSIGGAARVGFRSDAYDQVLLEAGFPQPPRASLYAIDNAAFLSARFPRLVVNLLTGRRVRFHDSNYAGRSPSPEQFEVQGRLYDRMPPAYEANAQRNLRLIERLRLLTRERGLKLLLVAPPVNPAFSARYPAVARLRELHAARMEMARKGAGPTVLTAALADPVDGADFFDGIHLSNRSVAQAYADWLAGHIEEAIDG